MNEWTDSLSLSKGEGWLQLCVFRRGNYFIHAACDKTQGRKQRNDGEEE